MMLLSDISTKGYDSFENAGYRVPKYNRKKMVTKTMESPFWIHFGAGNIFRAFQANVIEQLLNKGVLDRGLIVAEGYDYEIIDKIYHPYDNHSILVTLKTDGTVEKSVMEALQNPLFWIQKIFQLFPDCRKFSEAIPYKLQALPLQRKVISFVSRMVLIAKT